MREVDLFGIPVTVGALAEIEAAMGDQPMHLVPRVADLVGSEPWPALKARRFKVPCSDCRELCWCDPKSLVVPTALLICPHCLPNYLPDE